MPNWNSILGAHEQSIKVFGARSRILAANLANADTPNYKARDIDFKQMLASQKSFNSANAPLVMSNSRHMQPSGFVFGAQLKYRQPQQSSLDGNTVEDQIEKSEFLENAMRYQVSIQFISGKFRGLLSAIKGE
jgi:flagellar basal-body rod protein FlgB